MGLFLYQITNEVQGKLQEVRHRRAWRNRAFIIRNGVKYFEFPVEVLI